MITVDEHQALSRASFNTGGSGGGKGGGGKNAAAKPGKGRAKVRTTARRAKK